MGTNSHHREERKIQQSDVSEGMTIRDELYDEDVEVVGVHVGQVYLRYPHQEKLQSYKHECGAVLLGYDDLESHCEDCDERNDEWWDNRHNGQKLTEMVDNDECPYEVIERPGFHTESYGYDWPLDGHRFSVKN